MFRKVYCAALALAVAVAAGAVNAQTTVQDRPTTPPGAAGQPPARVVGAQPGDAVQLDQAIAACILLGNQEEIALAQFAKDRLQSDEAKKFAEMMVNDHRQAIEKLQRVAPQLTALNIQLEGAQPGQPAQAAGGARSPMIALQQSVAQECLQLTKKELEEKQGAEFDHCYIGQQVGAHIAMLAKLKGSKAFASPQLQQYIDEATQAVERHHAEAKKIAKSLMEKSRDASSDQARRDAQRQ